MALPLNTSELLVHLRECFVTTNDNEVTRRVVGRVQEHLPLLAPLVLLESPPITFDIARHISRSFQRVETAPPKSRGHRKKLGHHKRKKTHQTKELPHPKPTLTTVKVLREDIAKLDNSENVDATFEPYAVTDLSPSSSPSTSLSVQEEDDTKPRSVGLSYTKTIDPKKKSKSPSIVSLLRGGKKATKKSSDQNLELIEEEHDNRERAPNTVADGTSNDSDDSNDSTSVELSIADDTVSIDSDFGVPVNEQGLVVRNADPFSNLSKKKRLQRAGRKAQVSLDFDSTVDTISNADQRSDTSDIEINRYDVDTKSEYDNDEEESFDDDDDDDDGTETSSTDSAFTDIEANSILDDSSVLLDSFQNDSYGYLESYKIGSSVPTKRKQQTTTVEIMDHTAPSSDQGTSMAIGNGYFGSGAPSFISLSVEATAVASLKPLQRQQPPRKSPSLEFPKIDPVIVQPLPHASTLSSLIKSKHRSINVNPLTYFAFVNSGADDKLHVNVFLPPSTEPTLLNMQLNVNTSVFDCIGYILMQLHKLPDGASSVLGSNAVHMSPNHWQLEMVDSDGESYGTFGILARSRVISSYNGLTDVALIHVDDRLEFARNELQTPLPLDFKEALAKLRDVGFFENQDLSTEVLEGQGGKDAVEIKILDSTDNSVSRMSPTKYVVSRLTLIGNLLRNHCAKYSLDPNKFVLKEIQRYRSLLKSEEDTLNVLQDNVAVSSLNSTILELIPMERKSRSTGNDEEYGITAPQDDGIDAGITPLEGTYRFDYVDREKPSSSKTVADVNKEKSAKKLVPSKPIARKTQLNKPKAATLPATGANFLDDSEQFLLPTNLNSIYFKWKVWRKKTTILNKIEKSLVIDGDYIHLTPSDDVVFKKNPFDSSYTPSNTSHPHNQTHHHFHHYNYTNYYNNLMMKTTSFHVTQIVKLKQYKNSKNPTHFKIVTKKLAENGKQPNKKYDLEAVSVEECDQIVEKIKWVQQVYKNNMNFA
jgi:hypothetical protein